jgi:hypothetical protein
MSDDPFAPPGDQAPWGAPGTSPWDPPRPTWDAPAWAPPPVPWGPPGWEAHQAPNVVVPIDPFEKLMYHRRRALIYGFGSLALTVLLPVAVVLGIGLLLVGVGLLFLLGALVGAVVAAVLAGVSLSILARHRGFGVSQWWAALPAVTSLALLLYYVVNVVAARARG